MVDDAHGNRRVIKGVRNALAGVVDEEDDRRGPKVVHNVPMFFVSLGDEFAQIGIECWLLERPDETLRQPNRAFVNPAAPIVLTLHGQNHGELPVRLIRRDAGLPYLAQRLVVHVNCDSLSSLGRRALFASSREETRRGLLRDRIVEELIRVLKSDDELARFNEEARRCGIRERDEKAIKEIRREVAKLLRAHGVPIGEAEGAHVGGTAEDRELRRARTGKALPEPIVSVEPPTYLRLLWPEDQPITFWPGQRRYLRIETDAAPEYHDPGDRKRSRINFVLSGPIALVGSTPLRGGRLRAIVDAESGAKVGAEGVVRVELARVGLPTISDERKVSIIETPPARHRESQVGLPPFDVRPVGPDDEMWRTLGWPDDYETAASTTELEDGKLVIYYSTVFPKYKRTFDRLASSNTGLADSFQRRYEVWIATHSLLYYKDLGHETEEDVERERRERCRVAALAALFAEREVKSGLADAEGETESD